MDSYIKEHEPPIVLRSGDYNAFSNSDFNEAMGVYACSGIYNGGFNGEKLYIGSSKEMSYRIYFGHIVELRGDRHENIHFQRGWKKHGENQFVWLLLATTSLDKMTDCEQLMFDKYEPFGEHGFNIARVADRPPDFSGKTHSEKTRLEMTEIRKNLHSSGAYKNRKSNYNKASAVKKDRKIYYFQSPRGEKFTVDSLLDFCKEHNLNGTHSAYLGRGERKHVKGWTMWKPTEQRTTYYIFEKDGAQIEASNVNKFSKENGFRSGSLSALIHGHIPKYAGMTFLRKETRITVCEWS